jgi:hypothetical protein
LGELIVCKKRLKSSRRLTIRRVADWLNRSSKAQAPSEQSELAEAIQDLILFARAWRDPETGFDEGDIERLEEQKERIDLLLAKWPARYTVAGMDAKAIHSAFFTLTPLSDCPTEDWHRFLDLVRIAEEGALGRLQRCGSGRIELVRNYACDRWFYAEIPNQRFCSRKCHDRYWDEVRRSNPKFRSHRKIYQQKYYKKNYTKP